MSSIKTMRNILTVTIIITNISACTTTEYATTRVPMSDYLVGTDVKYSVKPNCLEKKPSKITAIDGDYITMETGEKFHRLESCGIEYQKTHANPFWYMGKSILFVVTLPWMIVGALAGARNGMSANDPCCKRDA
jgi:hypothetical protein